MRVNKPPRGTLLDRSHPLNRGLVGFWIMNEGNGIKISDVTGFHHGESRNLDGTEWVAGRDGWAFDLGTGTDYIFVADSDALDLVGPGFTIMALIYPRAIGTDNRIVDKGGGTGGAGGGGYTFEFKNNGPVGALQFRINDTTSAISSANVVSANSWFHVAFTSDNSLGRFYVNGLPAGTDSDVQAITAGTFDVNFGRKSGTNAAHYNGKMSDVRIYNRVLSPREIAWIYREPYVMFKQRKVPQRFINPTAVEVINLDQWYQPIKQQYPRQYEAVGYE